MTKTEEMRFEFGRNWRGFVQSRFTQERADAARKRILLFLSDQLPVIALVRRYRTN